MSDTRELPFFSTVELAFRLGYRTLRFGGRLQPDSLPEIIASRKMGLMCAAIPLCGSRTLKNLFLSNPNVDFEAEVLRDTVPNVLRLQNYVDKPLLFSVVRNPWSRIVSCYEKKIRGARHGDADYVARASLHRYYRRYKAVALIAGYQGLCSSMSFDAFVEWLCDKQGQDEVANRHWMSQHRFLSLSEVGSLYTRIIKLESLESDLNEILATFGLPYQRVGKINSSATTAAGRLHAATREYYRPKTINAVGDRYARDVELFKYDF